MSARIDSTGPAAEPSLTAWLRTVLWGAFIVPLCAFFITIVWGYDRAQREFESTVTRASGLALRHAERTFAIAHEVAQRVDRVSVGSDAEVRAREAALHQRLADMAAGLPSIVNINIWDATGKPLARSDAYPVDARNSVADRDYFREQQRAERDLGVSEVLTGRQTGRELVNVTTRRHAGSGRFDGVIAISMSPEFFRDYYRGLVVDQPDLATFALMRDDGSIIARWPLAADGRAKAEPDSPVQEQIARGVDAGLIELAPGDGRGTRLVSYQRVPGLPLYVAAGVSRAAMLSNWLRFVGLLAVIFIPITAGLLYVSWVALRKTRREQQLSAAIRDAIERNAQAERAALETQKLEALSQLTGGVAHDFNNLLTIISNNLHLLTRHHPAMKEARQIQSMSRAVTSGVRLTRQLLSFSRKQALRPETVELQQWLPATEGLIRSILGGRIVLDFVVEADTRPITVDLGELELALINTALNAKHAMPEGGTVRVTAKNERPRNADERPTVLICVEDTGVGIAPELLSKVFQPFFTTKGAGKGSGLGLSQVAGLCDQAGGVATVESEPGHGTAVGMHFPAAAPTGRERPSDDLVDAERVLAGSVLLVEDNDDVAVVTENVLRSAGLEVTRAANADGALELVEVAGDRLDLLVSDITMPGRMDGIEFAFVVRKRFPALPVLLLTGYAERIDDARDAGFNVLAKPFPPQILLAEIARLLAVRPERAASPQT